MLNKMPCHITDMGDADDTTMSDREISEEDEAIRDIADAILDGDSYTLYGAYPIDFRTIVEDELACNVGFANALRKIANDKNSTVGGKFKTVLFGLGEVLQIIDDTVLVQARNIYEQ